MTRSSTLLVLVLCLAAPAFATQVDRAEVTLGALTDEADLVLVARVEAVDAGAARLVVDATLKGEPMERVAIPRGAHDEVTWRAGARLVVFLARDARGGVLAPATSWQAVALESDAAAREVVAAVRARLPRIVEASLPLPGAQDEVTSDPLRAALFEQLASSVERVRDDAAKDLLRFRALDGYHADRAALLRALAASPTPDLLALAARLPDASLLAPVLAAARSSEDPATVAAAGAALRRLDPQAAVLALSDDLAAGASPARALRAARALGALGGEDAASALASALDDARPAVRAGALRALARCDGALAASAGLERVARRAGDEAPLALAVLARIGAGAALARLEATLQGEARALASALRGDPVTLAERLLAE